MKLLFNIATIETAVFGRVVLNDWPVELSDMVIFIFESVFLIPQCYRYMRYICGLQSDVNHISLLRI